MRIRVRTGFRFIRSSRATVGLLAVVILTASINSGIAEATECDSRTGACPTHVKVPGPLYQTVQSAIDAVADEGTVQLSAGLYSETVRIQAKRVNLVGPDREEGTATIVGADRDLGTIIFGGGGGGSLKNLSIQGGAYGVAADGEVLPSPVEIKDTSISKTGRGVFGTFSDLTIKDTQISETSWNGVSVTGATSVSIQDVEISFAKACGLFLSGTGLAQITDPLAILNEFGGICIFDSDIVEILGGQVLLNFNAGIFISSSSFVAIEGTEVVGTQPRLSDGHFGDGIDIWGSEFVGVLGSRVAQNARAGLANFGSHVILKNTEFCCNFGWDLEGETLLGEEFSFENQGGNTCGCGGDVGECTAETVGLQAPEPIGA